MDMQHELTDSLMWNTRKCSILSKKDYEKLWKEVDLNLMIADRFYEIAPDVWENFKKECEEE